jgi:excinuclease ABC subunit C
MNLDSRHERLAAVPDRPGVYLLRDARGQVIYVGKAAGLRARLRTYFQEAHDSVKLEQLAPRIADFEYILTDSAHEALLLENLLIKEHQPRFNVRLRDDKTYPYLKVDLSETFPRVFITRRVENDGARYFGPYSSTSSVRRTLELVKRLFPYRSCNRLITGNDPRPASTSTSAAASALIGAASQDEYAKVIEQVILFLEASGQVLTSSNDR